jgi:1-acyl-sn-glycerol-3-phosphate acyltransferase
MRPTPEELAVLTRTERTAFELADLVTTRAPGIAAAWNTAFMGFMIWGAGGRRLDVRGLEHLAGYGPRSRVLFVANHRSFFDFFVVSAICFWKTKLSKRIVFPVRSSFFYDHPAGPPLNLVMSGMSMFPPILRDRSRANWNRYALARCLAELERPGTVMGLHPEGTRGKGPDPYSFLPAQPGVGRVALETTAPVHPVFLHGLTNDLIEEWRRNWFAPKERHPISVLFGPKIDLADLRAQGSRAATHKRAADRCLAAIGTLAGEHRAAPRIAEPAHAIATA